MYFALVNFYAQCKLHSAECSLHWRVWMPNVKCILRDALYIGVFLGASIFGHVENAFLKIFFVSCYNIELLILPWVLDCEVGSWIHNAKFSKKIFAEKFLVKKYLQKTFADKLLEKIFLKKLLAEKLLAKNLRTKHLQRNFWSKTFEESICRKTFGEKSKNMFAEKLPQIFLG